MSRPQQRGAGPVRGAAFGLAAAALFGVSAPLAKLLLPVVEPLVLAGLLYLGAAAALILFEPARRRIGPREAKLRATDALPLLGIVVLGGIAGPVLMLLGLQRLSGVAGALLLNLEAPFTIALAVLLFREHLDLRELLASALVIGGATVLAFRPGELHADLWGIAALTGACLAWGVDNNLTQRLSVRDPIAVVRIKALGAGTCTLSVAWLVGMPLPAWPILGGALVLGAFSYGVSIVLDMYALRILGAAREAAYFATAPFIGAVAALPLLGETLGGADLGAGALMAAGVVLLLRAQHSHRHTHTPLEHDHVHVHDEHHRHEHEGEVTEPHSHPHRHEELTHEHPHASDVHHRHRHPPGGHS